MNRISFMGANLVAQQLGWNMTEGWSQGDAAANAHYAPLATFEARFDAFVASAVAAGFDTVDVWHPQLSYQWATPAHLEAAQRVLDRHGVTVASYGSYYGDTVEEFRRANEVASALGTRILGGQTSLLASDRAATLAVLEEFGNVLGLENHPQRSAAELLAEIGTDSGGLVGATVDTGWFATQGADAAQAIRELGENVFYVHLKDVRAAGAHDTCALGDGVVPVADCVRALAEVGYRGTISIEHEPEHYDPFAEVEISRQRLLALLQEAEDPDPVQLPG
jgi:L-ribulose-5-phosphate 3-epimerase